VAPTETPAPRTRSRGGAGRGRRPATVASATEATTPLEETPAPRADMVSVAPAADEPSTAEQPNGDTPTADGQAPSRRRRGGSRGGARRRPAGSMDAAEIAPEPEVPAPVAEEPRFDVRPRAPGEESRAQGAERPVPFPGRNGFNRNRPRPAGGPGPQQVDTGQRPSQAQPAGAGQARGSVESLIARQNVLFEEFAQQQAQTLTELQRTVQTLGGRTAGTGAGGTAIMPKCGIFLDVPNLMYAAEQANVRVHFGKLLSYLTQGRQLIRATAYAPITDDPLTRYETQRFVAPVINQGYKVVTKPWKRFADGGMKANFDIELAVDILTMADRLDIVILLSGDGDFRRVCELVESKGVRVEVVAFGASTAQELRSVADQYTDLAQIMNLISV
jgi:uncharacterized LabA/DUF88 family protein